MLQANLSILGSGRWKLVLHGILESEKDSSFTALRQEKYEIWRYPLPSKLLPTLWN